jgi:hypothetical protein
MYRPGFELCGFDTLTVQRKQVVLRALLEALVVADWNYIWHREQSGEGLLPSIYEIGPRYVLKVRPAGIDSWQDIPRTLELGSGDCKDFACWRIAELRHAGYDDVFPHIKVTTVPDPKGIEPEMTVYHIQVRIHETIEDPSLVLGMPSNATYDQLRGDSSEALLPPISAGAFPGVFEQHQGHQAGGFPGGVYGHHQIGEKSFGFGHQEFGQHPGHFGYGYGPYGHPPHPSQFGPHPSQFGYHQQGLVNQFGAAYGR